MRVSSIDSIHFAQSTSSKQDHDYNPHPVFMPYMAHGHMIPIVDMVRLFARRGATPVNAARFAASTGSSPPAFPSDFALSHFPPQKPACRRAARRWISSPPEMWWVNISWKLMPKPVCVVADVCLPWTAKLAHNLGIPKFLFCGTSGFAQLCVNNIQHYKLAQTLTSDSKNPKSIVYVCFGSLSHLNTSELIEVGLGLEASNHNFIWVVRLGKNSQEMERWMEEFEERVKERGLVVKGWAHQLLTCHIPQLVPSSPIVGGTQHWRGFCAGVLTVTWPMFADQFFNEKVIVAMSDVGVCIGVKQASKWGQEEEVGGLVDREMVKKAVEMVFDEGEEGEERRRRAKELAEKAKEAIEVGGSSYRNVDLFMQDVLNYAN